MHAGQRRPEPERVGYQRHFDTELGTVRVGGGHLVVQPSGIGLGDDLGGIRVAIQEPFDVPCHDELEAPQLEIIDEVLDDAVLVAVATGVDQPARACLPHQVGTEDEVGFGIHHDQVLA